MRTPEFSYSKTDSHVLKHRLKETWGWQACQYIQEIHFGLDMRNDTDVTILVLTNGRSWKGTYEQAEALDPAMIVLMGVSGGSDTGRQGQRQS